LPTTGVSLVILSFERLAALRELLDAVLGQDLQGIRLEVLLANNSPRVDLRPSAFNAIGRLLRRLPDVKVINSSHNWLCRARYALATLARHDTILFLDDDLIPVHPGLVRQMLGVLETIRPIDILSCWTALWTRWDDHHLTKVRMGFLYPETTELTECDYVGPGISMFRKRMLLHPAFLDLPEELQRSDSAWFPWLPAMELGSRKYYMPSHGMLRIHPESRKHALASLPGFRAGQYAAYKAMWKRGYTPILTTERHRDRTDTPEARAARTLRAEIDDW
jgi:glycosyltransferase involved in cell wall biosynthesis